MNHPNKSVLIYTCTIYGGGLRVLRAIPGSLLSGSSVARRSAMHGHARTTVLSADHSPPYHYHGPNSSVLSSCPLLRLSLTHTEARRCPAWPDSPDLRCAVGSPERRQEYVCTYELGLGRRCWPYARATTGRVG